VAKLNESGVQKCHIYCEDLQRYITKRYIKKGYMLQNGTSYTTVLDKNSKVIKRYVVQNSTCYKTTVHVTIWYIFYTVL
jgi:hypothetical protein